MEWNKIGLMFSLSRFKTYVNITTSTDCYLVPGSNGDVCNKNIALQANSNVVTEPRVKFGNGGQIIIWSERRRAVTRGG